jgi:hypothetical protein
VNFRFAFDSPSLAIGSKPAQMRMRFRNRTRSMLTRPHESMIPHELRFPLLAAAIRDVTAKPSRRRRNRPHGEGEKGFIR